MFDLHDKSSTLTNKGNELKNVGIKCFFYIYIYIYIYSHPQTDCFVVP